MKRIAVEPKSEVERAIRHMKYMLYGAPFTNFMIIAQLLHKVILRLPTHLHGHDSTSTTDVYKRQGQYIISKIKEVYLDHNIIDEEAGVIDNKSEYTWIIDPIDGTSNFASGVPLYGIMIGLLEEATPIDVYKRQDNNRCCLHPSKYH